MALTYLLSAFTTTCMTGSSTNGWAFFAASWKAIAAAVLKAASVESVSWYEPSCTSTRTPTIGYPRRTPFAIDSLLPLSIESASE